MGDRNGTDIESQILRIVDKHAREIQYSIYTLGFIGAAIVLRSTHIFRKFHVSQDIPKEFITKGMKLQGKIIKIHPIPIAENPSIFNIARFAVEHIPIASFPWSKNCSTMTLEMAGVWPSSKGTEKLESLLLNKTIWFRMYGASEDFSVIYSSIQLKVSWRIWNQRDAALILLKQNLGKVSTFNPKNFTCNSNYSVYYRKLLQNEVKYMKKT